MRLLALAVLEKLLVALGLELVALPSLLIFLLLVVVAVEAEVVMVCLAQTVAVMAEV
jgi:hypothetical protein